MGDEQALSHLRIIDLTDRIAGPYCTKLLADFGAEVIKIEPPDGGDPGRSMQPTFRDARGEEQSGLFLYLNTNKRSIVLDLNKPHDRQTLKDLVAHSNALVESFMPGVMDSFGLGYQELRRHNPGLVMTSITGFGQKGPYRTYQATDIVAYALTGLMSITGACDREPLKHGLHQASFRAGQYAAAATLAGIFAAQRNGHGQHVDVSMMECMVTGFVMRPVRYSYYGEILGREPKSGTALTNHAQPIETSDGYVIPDLAPGTSWEEFAQVVEAPALLEPRFSAGASRQANVELDEVLQQSIKNKRRYDLVHEAQEKRIPFSIVQSPSDLLHCPHLRERDYFIEVDQPGVGQVKMPGPPFHMSKTPHEVRRPAPGLGEHTPEVMAWLRSLGPTASNPTAADSQESMSALPLAGVRVLEPAAAYAAPHMGKLLAWLGAEVIKIESMVRPCNLRGVGRGPAKGNPPGYQYWNYSGSHNDVNLGKKNITLDFRTPEGIAAFKELVSISDVVIENFTPRVMKGFGLGYDDLVKIRPDLIMASVTGYGHAGPYRNYATFGQGVEAMTGCDWATGYFGEGPRSCGMAYPDDLTAIHAFFAVLAALQYRARTGQGQWIDSSMYEAGNFVAEALMDYILNGNLGERLGNRDRACVPQGCYRCRGDDQWVTLSVGNHEQWVALCNLIGKTRMAHHPDFQTKEQRWERHAEIDRCIQEWTRSMDKVQAMHELQKAGIPAGAVMSNKEALINRHLRERSYYAWVTHADPELGKRLYPGLPFTFNGRRLPNPTPTPKLGEDNWPVLTELLGRSADAVKDWEARDIIGTVPLAARTAAPRAAASLDEQVKRGVLQGYDTDFRAILEGGESVG